MSVTARAGGAPVSFTARGGAAWVDEVAGGVATVACEAAGDATVTVESAGRAVVVPVAVAPPAAGAVRVTVTPATLALLGGTTGRVAAQVDAPPGVATDVRFYSADTVVAKVDSLFGVVQATRSGETAIVAVARADRRATAAATVVVTRASLVVTAVIPVPAALSLVVGDSARVSAIVQLAATAPPGTSDAATFASDDPSVVRVTADGRVRAVGSGRATVFVAPAAAPALRAGIVVIVTQPAP